MKEMKSGIIQKYLVVSSVLQFALYVGPAKASCPANLPYTTVTEDYSGFCYQFVDKEKYWTDAQKYCLKYGGSLVMLPDSGTNAFITGTLSSLSSWTNKGVWIGLNDRDSELNWMWATNTEEMQIPMDDQWTNWASGHPEAFLHSARDCVRMVRGDNWKWHETPCSTLRWKYKFICQYDGVISREQSAGATANGNRKVKLWAISSACVGVVAFVIIILIMIFLKRRQSKRENSSDFINNPMYDNSDSKPDIISSTRVNNVYVESSPNEVTKASYLNKGESLHESKLEPETDYLKPTPLLNISQVYLTTDISKPKAMNGPWKVPEKITDGGENQKTQGQMANDEIQYELPGDEHIYAEIPEKVNDK